MSFMKPLAQSGMFGMAGLAASRDKKPTPSIVSGAPKPAQQSMISRPSLY